jgi:hypothetical protein
MKYKLFKFKNHDAGNVSFSVVREDKVSEYYHDLEDDRCTCASEGGHVGYCTITEVIEMTEPELKDLAFSLTYALNNKLSK